MSITTFTLAQAITALVPSKANPRKHIDAAGIESLAASIKTDGLLQNLVVEPLDGDGEHQRFAIVSGHRRYRALQLLAERGALSEDFAVPVEIRAGLSKDDALRIATVENVQRANLAPLEEAAALAKLVRIARHAPNARGERLDDVAAQTGLSATTIKRRLVLNSLCKEAKAALRVGEITLAQAEALTLGSDDAQQAALDEIAQYGDGMSAERIRRHLLDARPSVAMAIFPRERYTGTVTCDLFADEQTSYFDDAEQFHALQAQAVEQLAEEYRQEAAWVEVTRAYRIPDWQYDEAERGEDSETDEGAGVLINLAPSGEVTVRTGLAKREMEEEDAVETQAHPLAPAKPRDFYGATLRRYIAHHKSVAVQARLLVSPRKAREIAAVQALMHVKPHASLRALAEGREASYAAILVETRAQQHADKLGFGQREDRSVWDQIPARGADECDLYEAVKRLTDAELDELHVLLASIAFGQANCERLDTGDSLFNRVAQDLALDMRHHWHPDTEFLSRHTRDQLLGIASECGCADAHLQSKLKALTKAQLVECLSQHFEGALAAVTPTPAQAKALAWLPEAMRFPASAPVTVNAE